jgi:hypothetical protein
MNARHLFIIYGLDVVIVLLAIGAAATANVERTREPFPRFQLLMPGLLAFAGGVILLSYPDIRDLAEPAVWMAPLIGVVGGGCRGALMRLEADRASRTVRVWHGRDAAWASWVMVLFATIQGSLETALQANNPYETTAEAAMLLSGGYLLGRSVVSWVRAQVLADRTLKD